MRGEVVDPFDSYRSGANAFDQWCKNHCTGRFDIVKYQHDRITAIFNNEQDALLFILAFGPATRINHVKTRD